MMIVPQEEWEECAKLVSVDDDDEQTFENSQSQPASSYDTRELVRKVCLLIHIDLIFRMLKLPYFVSLSKKKTRLLRA